MLTAVLIDHHDSFTFNIKAWLKSRFAVSIIDYSEVADLNLDNFDLVILSPGPKTPSDYPQTKTLLAQLKAHKPVLGICLGMQMMNELEAGSVMSYYPPVHGKTSSLDASDSPYDQAQVARYHSLKCVVPPIFDVLATSEGLPMIIRHKNKKWLGLQFHPESFLTEKPEVFLQMAVDLCSP